MSKPLSAYAIKKRAKDDRRKDQNKIAEARIQDAQNKGLVLAYTDGASKGNPGFAAAAYVVVEANGNTLVEKGFFVGKSSTNQMAEMQGLLHCLQWLLNNRALKALEKRRVRLFTDSNWVVNLFNGSYTARKYRDLFDRAYGLLQTLRKEHQFCVEIEFCPGHCGIEGNERCDKLANLAIESAREILVDANK